MLLRFCTLTFHLDVDEIFRDRLERELEAAHDVVGKLADDLENVLRQNLLLTKMSFYSFLTKPINIE